LGKQFVTEMGPKVGNIKRGTIITTGSMIRPIPFEVSAAGDCGPLGTVEVNFASA
jgi:2-keto-4-pentenoate hydratase